MFLIVIHYQFGNAFVRETECRNHSDLMYTADKLTVQCSYFGTGKPLGKDA